MGLKNIIAILNFLIKKDHLNYFNGMRLDINFEGIEYSSYEASQKGMVVHPGAGNYKNTLANALIYKYKNKLSNINGELRPGIVQQE